MRGGKSEPAVIFLMGATASGKTELAVELTERLPCEIVSVDSAMVYRGMDIGTAKPPVEVLARAPHRLIDILDPAEAYSAARFREDALREIGDILARGRIPLLAGGTLLYFRALEQGLAPLPSADPEVRARIDAEAAKVGWEALHRRLAAVDPRSAERIHPNDPQRLQRALEVYELTGRPLSEVIAVQKPEPFPYPVVKMVLAPADREALRERIAVRFHSMLEQGFLAEVEALYRRGDLDPEKPAIRCVGYRQAWSFLAGEWDYSTMVEQAITATRQLAKRQFTWLRGERDSPWFESGDGRLLDKVLKYLAATTI